MTDVLVTTWTSDNVPRTWPGSPEPGETMEEFVDRYVTELRAVLRVLPPDPNTETKTVWEIAGQCAETRGEEEGAREFAERYVEELLEDLAANPPSPS